MSLPGGDAALSSLALGNVGDQYLLAYLNGAANAPWVTTIDTAGVAAEPRKLGAVATSGSVTPGAPRLYGRGDRAYLTWNEEVYENGYTTTKSALQVFDATAAPATKAVALASDALRGIDADLLEGRLRVAHFREGDSDMYLSQANVAGGLASFTMAAVKLPPPAPVGAARYHATVRGRPGGGAVFVDHASFKSPTNDTLRRIEVGRADAPRRRPHLLLRDTMNHRANARESLYEVTRASSSKSKA